MWHPLPCHTLCCRWLSSLRWRDVLSAPSPGLSPCMRFVFSLQLVELKNGETYNGHLVSCDNWMNINLREVICTSRVCGCCWEVLLFNISRFQVCQITSFLVLAPFCLCLVPCLHKPLCDSVFQQPSYSSCHKNGLLQSWLWSVWFSAGIASVPESQRQVLSSVPGKTAQPITCICCCLG